MESKSPAYNPEYNSHMDPPPPYQPYVQQTTTTYIPSGSTGSTTYLNPPAASASGPNYGSIPVVVQPVRAADVIVVGGCPACRVGVLSEDFTLAGLCCAFWFFPIGILCCLAMRERRCTNCGAVYS